LRQQLLRVVCDMCGFVSQFEIVNSNPLTVTTDVPWVLNRNGWTTLAKEGGSQFDTYDLCPACSRRTGEN
jgi:hypothetical protein